MESAMSDKDDGYFTLPKTRIIAVGSVTKADDAETEAQARHISIVVR